MESKACSFFYENRESQVKKGGRGKKEEEVKKRRIRIDEDNSDGKK